MKKILMLTAAVFAFQALPALAEDGTKHGGKKGEHFFEKVDTDKDGKISEAESLALAKERFKSMDGNSDGFVTKEEATAHHEAKRAEWKKKREEMKAKKAAEKPVEAPAAE